MAFQDHFSAQAKDYAEYRPQYPQDLFQYLASLVKTHDLAWDCATGNGQAAWGLTPYFQKIVATDPSRTQIGQAEAHPKITYQIAPAEKTSLADHAIDLITVAQALHWFDFEKFYGEVRRVTKPGGVLAAWTYYLFECEAAVDEIVKDFYLGTVGPYWPPERKYVEEKYESIPFPFEKTSTPDFFIKESWNLKEMIGYLKTWSATQKYIETRQNNPLPALERKLEKIWGPLDQKKSVRWQIYLKVGRV